MDIQTELQSTLRLVKCYDGVLVAVPDEVIDHVERKHPEMLSFLGFAYTRMGKVKWLQYLF